MTEYPITAYKTGAQGQMVTDYKESGRLMMWRAGVDPDKPLQINWKNVSDRRDNRDPENLWKLLCQKRSEI